MLQSLIIGVDNIGRGANEKRGSDSLLSEGQEG